MMRRVRTLSGFIGRKEMRRRSCKSVVKVRGSTSEALRKLQELSIREVSGILGGAVKCVDIERNTRGEGGSLAYH